MLEPGFVPEPGASPSRGRSVWYVALATVTGVALFALAVRRVDWQGVAGALGSVSPWWVALGVSCFALSHVALAARWRLLMNEAGVSLADAFDFLMIGGFAGLVLPSRLGDVARAVAAGRFHSMSTSRLLGTIVVERVLDVIMLLIFALALSLLMSIPPVIQGALAVLLVVTIVVAAVLWMGESGPMGVVLGWLVRLRGPVSRSIPIFTRFLAGIGVVRTGGVLSEALLMAAVGWSLSAVAATCNLAAFGLPVPWYAGVFVVVVINLGGIIPAPPAGIGVYHYLAMLALSPWVSDSSTAFAFALVMHAVSFGTMLVLGSISMARKGLSLAMLRRIAAEPERTA